MVEAGQVVFSKKGRDKGLPFIVVNVSGEYLFLADGRLRKLEKPKKKKKMHVQSTKTISEDVRQKLLSGGYLLDADIRKALEPFTKNEEGQLVEG